ncbi:hypothetical protein [Polaromonas sp. JS666]|uniref:hypothetical protein n=1 Tax=Polaromonas sp. (strain JS666 / ATCC BAA-500) TaxID=296591 RepID=UPI0000536A98|nr:hypothetical protein [Polaromonas sp. JS666]ABE45795.1 hypothetical protein Bpro_3899 [Polaromonas sp. JS666]
MTVTESIDKFCEYFERQSAAIGCVTVSTANDADSSAGSEFRYRKVLCLTAIDTLAGLRYHKSAYPQLSRQNRERFTRFVKEHGSWPEGELVSLPFLRDELKTLKLLHRPLGQHVTQKVDAHSTDDGGSLLVTEIDEPADELLALASTEKEEEAIRDYQHRALLYRYRNSLVHESREPGMAMEVFPTSGAPYYHGYIGDPNWYLAYPPPLFTLLLQRAIASFRTYLSTNSIDPYALVEDQARW